MDELKNLQEEFREVLEEIREKIKKWDGNFIELKELKINLQKDLEQVSKEKKGSNKETIEGFYLLKKRLEKQEKIVHGLQKRWEVILFFQLVLLIALIFLL